MPPSKPNLTPQMKKLLDSIEETKQAIDNMSGEKSAFEEHLLPRRAEILNIIRDHEMVNFDRLRRRFMAVNERTLRYDLKKLQDAGLIRKLGATKGVYYTLASTKEE